MIYFGIIWQEIMKYNVQIGLIGSLITIFMFGIWIKDKFSTTTYVVGSQVVPWQWAMKHNVQIGLIGSLITIFMFGIWINDKFSTTTYVVGSQVAQGPITLKGVFCISGSDNDTRGYLFVNDVIDRALEAHNIDLGEEIALISIDGNQLDSIYELTLTVRSIVLLPGKENGSDYCNFAVTPGVGKLLNVSMEGDTKTRDEHVLEVKRVD